MGSSVQQPPGLLRRVSTAAVGLVTVLGVSSGVLFLRTVKNTPSGASANRNIECWETSSGGQVMCLRETGVLHLFSGALVIDGVTIGTGATLTQTSADTRYVNTSGDTMTGQLIARTNTFGAFSGTTVSGAGGDFAVTSTGDLVLGGLRYTPPTSITAGTFLQVGAANALSWASAGGGLTSTSKTANYTAVSGDLVLADSSAGTFDVTLPGNAADRRVGVILSNTSSSNVVYVKSPTANILVGSGTTLSGSIVLYVVGDSVVLQNNGTNWYITEDRRVPHKTKLIRAAAQTLTNGTYTKIAFDAEAYDDGQIGDIATNDRVDIRRAGRYEICVNSGEVPGLDGSEHVSAAIYQGGALVEAQLERSANTDIATKSSFCTTRDLPKLARIEFYVRQNEGADQNTDATEGFTPRMTVSEILPR